MPAGPDSLRRAAWAGLQDSMPRAALLSLYARVEGVEPSTWEHPSLIQLWGPRFSTYVVAERDFALFSLGRLPDGGKGRERAERMPSGCGPTSTARAPWTATSDARSASTRARSGTPPRRAPSRSGGTAPGR